jgi:hypothetical protein
VKWQICNFQSNYVSRAVDDELQPHTVFVRILVAVSLQTRSPCPEDGHVFLDFDRRTVSGGGTSRRGESGVE